MPIRIHMSIPGEEKQGGITDMKFSKAIVTLVVLLNAAFTTAVLFIFYRVGVEPTTLIAAWFGFTTVELWALAGIKKREIDKSDGGEY